jgi:hypothetical protein
MSKTKETKNKFVKHIRDHKGYYITAVVSAAAGAALMMIPQVQQIFITDVANLKVLSPTTTNNTNIIVKALGHPGFKVVDLTTGIEYPSINNAAQETGANVHDLRRHLHGDRPDAGGRIFKITGLADTSHLMV